MTLKKTIIIFLSISIPLAMYSCDCQVRVQGIVLDAKSKQPIENVAIGLTDTTELDNPFNRKDFTESTGEFRFKRISGLCSSALLYFSKEGYKTQKLELSNNSKDTIFLISTTKNNKKSINR